MSDSLTPDDRVAAKLAQLHRLCICRTDPVNWADVSALLTCAEALQMVRDYVVTMKGVGHEYQLVVDAALENLK